jgi:hypothetical protein
VRARQLLLALDDVDRDADRAGVVRHGACTDWQIHQVA